MCLKILVVSASEKDHFIMKSILNEYYILTAYNSIEAIQEIDINTDIALIIIDLNISNMDGFQLLNLLNSDSRYKKLNTIVLTDEPEDEIKGLRFGAVDCIHKPIQKVTLKSTIEFHFQLLKKQISKQDLYKNSLIYNIIFQQAPIGIAISYGNETFEGDSNNLISINPMFEKITGRSKGDILKLGWEKITYPDDLEEDIKKYKEFQSGKINGYSMEKRYIKPDGSIVWVDMIVAPLTLSNEHQYNHICLVQDITKRKDAENALSESERSKSILLSHLPGMAYRCKCDQNWTMQFVSAGCLELTGYSRESLLYNKDISFNDLITPEYRHLLWEKWRYVLSKGLSFKYEYEIITAKGERKWVLEMGEGVFNEKGEVETLEGIIFDISDRKKIENRLRYNNEHDIWTGLYNRKYLENLLRYDAKIVPPMGKKALVSINLSAMHLLSMTFGFHYSQDLIKKVADVLKSYCNAHCQLFNTYEYRFVFYIKNYKEKNELKVFCEDVANTLENMLVIERISGGIGVIEINEDNRQDIEQLLKILLITSEKAINTYETDFGICFFDKEMETEIIHDEMISHELSKIVVGEKADGLFLQYQPILDLKSNQICGFEALARLNSDNLGIVQPLKFIPIAEKTKLIVPLGKKIIIQAFQFLSDLKKMDIPQLAYQLIFLPFSYLERTSSKTYLK